MAIDKEFEDAQKRVQNLKTRPNNMELLELYALYKLGTTGDVTGKRPGRLDFKGRVKFDAWSKQKGVAKEEAMKKYVSLVSRMVEKYG